MACGCHPFSATRTGTAPASQFHMIFVWTVKRAGAAPASKMLGNTSIMSRHPLLWGSTPLLKSHLCWLKVCRQVMAHHNEDRCRPLPSCLLFALQLTAAAHTSSLGRADVSLWAAS